MQRTLAEIRGRLKTNGWRIAHETGADLSAVGAPDVELRLASTAPPPGRQVLVEFRVHEVDYDPWDCLTSVLRYAIVIRYPAASASPEFFLECDHYWHDYRTIFRVLEWFRDPTGHNLYNDDLGGDWLPPDDWDAERWRVLAAEAWDTTMTLDEMLHAVALTASERKLRLAACAICRHLPVSMLDDKNRLAVEMAERYAEGEIAKRELRRASKQTRLDWIGQLAPREGLYRAVQQLQAENVTRGKLVAADTLREVVGNPTRPVPIRRAWLYANGAQVRRLVEAVVAEQDYGILPVLADALEDAGCSEVAILEHCRQPRPHARGCWVVALLAGKV